MECIRAAAKLSFVHMDGTLCGLLPMVADTCFDVIEAVTPHTVGDESMSDWRSLAGSYVVHWEGLPGVCLALLVVLDDYQHHVRSTLDITSAD